MANRSGPGATQRDVDDFYARLVFPSRTSHAAYAALVPRQPGESIADFGCGQSLFYETLRDYRPAPVFLDLSMAALRAMGAGARIRGNLFHLPIQDASFDRIFCIGVVHHLPQPGPAIAEMARVLRPGGTLILGVYAPGTVQARLRTLYDASRNPVWRSAVGGATRQLIRLRHAGNGRGLTAEDVRLRTRDFLQVPFVRYVDPRFFADCAREAGLVLRTIERISGMNLLVLGR